MKVYRSTKVSLKFATPAKQVALNAIRVEYSRLVNEFVALFWSWDHIPENRELVAAVLHRVTTHASFRVTQNAAREAVSMVATAKNQPHGDAGIREIRRPVHYGRRMVLASTVAKLELAEKSRHFDAWLVFEAVQSLCGLKKLRIPIKLHRHYHKLAALGKQVTTVTIGETACQLAFEIDTGDKLDIRTP